MEICEMEGNTERMMCVDVKKTVRRYVLCNQLLTFYRYTKRKTSDVLYDCSLFLIVFVSGKKLSMVPSV